MENQDTGILLNKNNITLQRKYFNEFVKLKGIFVYFKAPKSNKFYDKYGDLYGDYYEPIKVGVIYNDHPNQSTMKKLGWDSELINTAVIISVPYDLKGLEVGALFIIPSGLDDTKGRVFRVYRMSNIAIYPASITCELIPVYENTFDKAELNYENSDFNLLNIDEEE